MRYTKEDLKRQLREMGLRGDDALMLHSSMKAIGDVEGGADTVLDAFTEYLKDGLFMVPTHTWKQMGEGHDVFDPRTEPGCVGIIPNLLLKRPGVFRSLHPTHSIAAIGKGAQEYVRGEENSTTPCPPEGCFGRLRDIGAKILLAGVTHVKNTYIHSIEESMDVPERFTAQPSTFRTVMPDGSLKTVRMFRHYNRQMAHISESFDKLRGTWEKEGVARNVAFGDAPSILCDARGLYDVTTAILKDTPDFFIPEN